MKHSIKLFMCIMFFFFSNEIIHAQAGIDFDVLDQLIMQNDDTRDPSGGLSGGGSGGGGSNIKIFTDWPKEGKMIVQDTKLKWESSKATPPYEVEITDDAGNVIFNQSTDRGAMNIELGKMPLVEGNTYHLKVKSTDYVSKNSKFKIAPASEMSTLLKDVKKNPNFKNAKYFKKITMKAFALEVKEFNFEAYQYYQTYMFDDKDDMTLRNLRDRFRSEYNIK